MVGISSISTFSHAVEFSDKLPIEIKQLAESFDCFSNEDKEMIYAYSLALKYRFENLKNKEALKKSDLDYWRLWHILSDIEMQCKLDYKFDDILEEILFPTSALQKKLTRLRWAESAIHTDGSSEPSEKMRRYDKQLKEQIHNNPPKWKFSKKNIYLRDYNLTVMKQFPKNTIALQDYKNIIKGTKKGTIKRKLLFRDAYLQERYIRNYDDKEKRNSITTELSYLSNCFKYYDFPQHSIYYGNEKRKLAGRVLVGNNINILFSKEMLPKQIKIYCEHNITGMELDTFSVKQDKPIRKLENEQKLKFDKTVRLLDSYKQKAIDTKNYKKYLQSIKTMMNGGGNDLNHALKIIRLKSCFDNTQYSKEFLKVLLTEVKSSDSKEEFSNKVMRPQMWWIMTIGMKAKQEGETKALKHFFDCNATNMIGSKQRITKKSIKYSTHVRYTHMPNYDRILSQKDEILKYYAATFVNKATPNINNKTAIDTGIIPSEYIDNNGTIKRIENVPLSIEGMPKGGIKLTYTGVPKGKACERLVTLNVNDSIFFDNKTYEGLDYILIDNQKIKVQHFNGKYARRLCNKQGSHTIGYVREKTIVEDKYKPKSVDSNNDKYHKILTIDSFRYHPDGVAISDNHKFFAVSGEKSALYDVVNANKVSILPEQLNYAFDLAINKKNDYIAVSQGNGFYFYGLKNKTIVTNIQRNDKEFETFRLQNLHFLESKILFVAIAENGKKVQILNPLMRKIVSGIIPKFFVNSKESGYRSPRITTIALSHNMRYLYIGNNRKQVEVWKISDDGTYKIKYLNTIELSTGREIGAILQDPFDDNNLYIAMKSNELILWDIDKKKVIKTYMADSYMDPENIDISSDGQFIMVSGNSLYLWKINDTIQWDIFSGDGLKGGMFIPKTDQLITIGKTIDRWMLNSSFKKKNHKKKHVKKKENKKSHEKPIKKINEKKKTYSEKKYDRDVKRGVPPIFAAIQNNLYKKLSELLDKGVDVQKKYKGVVPLIFAVYQHDDKLVEILLKHGANPNFVDRNGLYSPLSQACEENRISTAILLIKYGADVNYQYKKSETALTVAAKGCKNFELVQLLLDNGAKPDLIDIYRHSTVTGLFIQCKDKKKYEKMMKLLKTKSVLIGYKVKK